jgi:SAM-dependent methyltransferase
MRMTMQRGTARIFGLVTPYLPASLKREVKGRLPKRYYRYFKADWHRWALDRNGRWEALGRDQLDFLVSEGLQPHHYLLDIGCGPLRAGVQFLSFLEPGHYFGIDKDAARLAAGREVELRRYGVADRKPVLEAMDDFGFERLNQPFDYAIAQSVFPHLNLNQIIRCVMNVEKVLKPGGRFYATFYENPAGKYDLDDIEQKPTVITHLDRDNFHYDFGTFEWIADGTSLEPRYIGDWGEARNQKMLLFVKKP